MGELIHLIAKILIGITIAGSLNVTAIGKTGSALSNGCHSFPDMDTWQIRYIQAGTMLDLSIDQS